MTFRLRSVQLPLVSGATHRVVLVSEAAYHLDELLPVARELSLAGAQPELFLAEATAGPLRRFRSQHRRFSRSIEMLRSAGVSTGASIGSEQILDFDALVVMNDWGPCRDLVERANAQGRPSFGKVEGIQDFDDRSTGMARRPYGRVATVLCQGQNDFDALDVDRKVIVGNSRLEALLAQPPRASADGPVIINCNFSYGQLAEQRKPWLEMATQGCEEAGVSYRISKHPADRGYVSLWRQARGRIENHLDAAPVLISRFSSVCFEALCRGVPVTYLNPHGEYAGPFANPDSAFTLATTTADVAAALRVQPASSTVRASAGDFLARQVDVAVRSAAQRTTSAIMEALDD